MHGTGAFRLSVLDLAHRPAVVAVDDLLKDLEFILEGKAQVVNPAVRIRRLSLAGAVQAYLMVLFYAAYRTETV
jgi:hypothetical protein